MSYQIQTKNKNHEFGVSGNEDSGIMPYTNKVLKYKPEKEIELTYTLDLNEDLYLSHHMFIHASGVKEPSACLPVLPMTFGLELMAEAASCLAPDLGLIGFEKISALDWVGLRDTTTLPLIISARLEGKNTELKYRKVRVEIFKEGFRQPAMKCTVFFGENYLLSIQLEFEELKFPHRLKVRAGELYQDRYLFHGPLLHCISDIHAVGENGLIGEVKLFRTDNLFKTVRNPELLTHPSFMDGVAQLLVAWFINQDGGALPVGIESIEFYRPTPAPKKNLMVYLNISGKSAKTISVNIEVHDENGNVWMRIKNWKYWIFKTTKVLTNFLRFPESNFVSTDLNCPKDGVVIHGIKKADLQGTDPEWIARTLLHEEEMNKFLKLNSGSSGKKSWLLKRLAAKDALRNYLAKETSLKRIHPASFSLIESGSVELSVKEIKGVTNPPELKLEVSDEHVIAAAHRKNLSIPFEGMRNNSGIPFL